MSLKIKSTAVVKIERPAYGGVSIGRYGGKVVMIKGAVLPGETVEITIENEKRDYLTASAGKIMEPSPERTEPACRYFGPCGGCHYQHIPYDLQISLKEEILRDCLRRLAKIEKENLCSLHDASAWRTFPDRAARKDSNSAVFSWRSGLMH